MKQSLVVYIQYLHSAIFFLITEKFIENCITTQMYLPHCALKTKPWSK